LHSTLNESAREKDKRGAGARSLCGWEDSAQKEGEEQQKQRDHRARPGLTEDEQMIEEFHSIVFFDAAERNP